MLRALVEDGASPDARERGDARGSVSSYTRGHSSVAITIDRYGHLYEGREQDMVDVMETVYQEATEAQAKVIPAWSMIR